MAKHSGHMAVFLQDVVFKTTLPGSEVKSI